MDTTFETLAGTFQCYLYNYLKSQGEDILHKDNIFEFYAPRIGLVGREIKAEGFDLVDYRKIIYDYQIK